MASVRNLKKKIKIHTVQLVAEGLNQYESNHDKAKTVKELIEEVVGFTNESVNRINSARGMDKKERRAELKSVEEQFRDKQILHQQSLKK